MSKAIAKKSEMSPILFQEDAGSGTEGATAESYAIPFLTVLQKMSPQCDEDGVEGAKAGMLLDTISNTLYSGKTGVLIVPCAYRRVFIRWGAKDAGGGFKGEVLPEEVARMRDKGQIVEVDGQLFAPNDDGKVDPKTSDTFKDTRNHYVMIVEENGSWRTALMSLTSTQIKKSKMLMSALVSVKVEGKDGLFTPPTFANLVRVKSTAESNDKGSWHGYRFELEGFVDDPAIYAAAKAFHKSVLEGQVQAKYEEAEEVKEGF